MKKLHTFIMVFLVATAITAQDFFDINTIQTIEITFAESNWDALLDAEKAGDENYIMAKSVAVNGFVFDSVGVKYKGNSTYNPNQVKNPFHIELDTYKDQNYKGYADIKLSNAANDPSFLREVLSYQIIRQYMDAPLSNFANVYVNGKLIGLYSNSESVSKKFVKSRFGSKNNAFIKCNPPDGAGPGSGDYPNLVYLGQDSTSYYDSYELKSNAGWQELIDLCDTLKNSVSEIEKMLDVNRALWMLALDNVLVNLDSYIGQFSQNYYLYRDDNRRFIPVIWDLNESFGRFSQTGTINLPNTTSKQQMSYLLHINDASFPLVQKLLSIPQYKRMYLAHCKTILLENFDNYSYFNSGLAMQTIIDAAVKADNNKFFTYNDFINNLTKDISGGGPPGPGSSSTPGITNLMDGRNTYLLALSDFKQTEPAISNITISNETPNVNETISISALIQNASSAYLGFRSEYGKVFQQLQMFDDGNHDDGSANDGTFGVEVQLRGTNNQYYIYAENANTGMFSPRRAEHEFYTIKAEYSHVNTSDILMNEIYAKGTTDDPDWVEIYNSSSSSLDISGYKIYDSGGQSGSKPKKEFPVGSVIEPEGFLVIVTEDGSASAFGLSSSGEKVWLENAAGVIIDTVTFLAHTEFESYGRYPDGADWMLLDSITKGASNSFMTEVKETLPYNSISLLGQNYPNPFKDKTTIKYSVLASGNVVIKIYDVLGNEAATLVNQYQQEGVYSISLNSKDLNLNDGVYFYRLNSGNISVTKTMVIIK